MLTVHKTTIVAKCPSGAVDVYEAEFTVDGRTLLVEDIQAAIDSLTKEPIYQEDLTQQLADRLGCLITTSGKHGKFQTECICGDLEVK